MPSLDTLANLATIVGAIVALAMAGRMFDWW